jgi:HlyD family secretion protein
VRARRAAVAVGVAALLSAGCQSRQPAPLYEKVPVERRTIVVAAAAAGVIEPVTTVAVKSKASGEIIQLNIETGQEVRAGQLLSVIDPRQPKNNLAQAEADLDVARSQLAIADTKQARADTLYQNGAIAETEVEDAHLAYVTARAQVVRAQAALDIARDQMDDTRVVAPVAGTIITKDVELGTVISSPTKDVGGGSVLFTMANLDTVQIRTLVDETDIGMVRIANPEHLLLPGMNAEVEIHVGVRENVLAVPYAALRTARDAGSAAAVLGLDPAGVQAEIAQAKQRTTPDSAAAGAGRGSTYIVFALRDGKPVPVTVRTGLTDLDYVEVVAGLAETDTVLVLPSASLIASQQQMRERIQRMTGGGGIPGMQQNPTGQAQPPRR